MHDISGKIVQFIQKSRKNFDRKRNQQKQGGKAER